MNMRGKEFTAATGGGPGGAADAGERNLAPATVSPHVSTSTGPASGVSRPHESARAQVAGTATYVDDIPEVKGTLHAAPILSTVAHGRLLGVDTAAALAMPGVRGVVLARRHPRRSGAGDLRPRRAGVRARHRSSTSARSSAWWWPTR